MTTSVTYCGLTGPSRFSLLPVHGREMSGPRDKDLAAFVRRDGEPPEIKEDVNRLAKRLAEAQRTAREYIHRGWQKQRE
jgi:hypothetical protein